MGCSLPHLGQGGRDNAPLLKYLHVQKWCLHFDEKYLSFSLTFSKCQVPIRGEYADGRIWICFLGCVIFYFIRRFWNNLIISLVFLLIILWILSSPIRLLLFHWDHTCQGRWWPPDCQIQWSALLSFYFSPTSIQHSHLLRTLFSLGFGVHFLGLPHIHWQLLYNFLFYFSASILCYSLLPTWNQPFVCWSLASLGGEGYLETTVWELEVPCFVFVFLFFFFFLNKIHLEFILRLQIQTQDQQVFT